MNFSKSNGRKKTDPGSLALLLADVNPVAGVVLLHLHRLHLLLDRLHPGVIEWAMRSADGTRLRRRIGKLANLIWPDRMPAYSQ